jgi:hypothetical protein
MDGGQTAEHSGARTDPMDMKNPKVAAEESMYCDSVATTPLGPGPALRRSVSDQRSAISAVLGVGSAWARRGIRVRALHLGERISV